MLLNMLGKGWLTKKYNIKKKLVITRSNHTNNNNNKILKFVTVDKYTLSNKSIFIKRLLKGKDVLSSDTPYKILIVFWSEENNIYFRTPVDVDWWYDDSINNYNFICALANLYHIVLNELRKLNEEENSISIDILDIVFIKKD